MKPVIVRLNCVLLLCFSLACAQAQHVSVPDPTTLSDSVYRLLAPYPVILFGEMHGVNESAPFVYGLARLFSEKGDSVQLGLEIPAAEMEAFLSRHSDSSVYQCRFFNRPPIDGRESAAWAELIVRLNRLPGVQVFFFDKDENDPASCNRDSLMCERIRNRARLHPGARLITLGGNYHNRLDQSDVMADYLSRDRSQTDKICALNLSYSGGTCRANFGKGLTLKTLNRNGSPQAAHLRLLPADSGYPYNGYYYCGQVTAAEMVYQR